MIEGVWRRAGSARRECDAPAVDDPVHRVGGHVVRGRELRGHGRVCRCQACTTAALRGAGRPRAEPRHVQPPVPPPRSQPLRGGPARLHGPVRRPDPMRGSAGRQRGAPCLWPGRSNVALAPSRRVCPRGALGVGPAQGAKAQRDCCRARGPQTAPPGGLHRHRRRLVLLSQHGQGEARSRRRLRHRAQEQQQAPLSARQEALRPTAPLSRCHDARSSPRQRRAAPSQRPQRSAASEGGLLGVADGGAVAR